MNPKHKNPSRLEPTAHAPYNFVPLPEKIVLAEPLLSQDQYYADRNTGYIECTLTTESPLYTRAALNPQFFREWADKSREMMKNAQAREQYAQCFHVDDAQQPVIPASSLRGMVRSLVEIAGYGKVQWVTKAPLVFRAVADTTSLGQVYRSRMKPLAVRAGFLQSRGYDWQIQPALPIGGQAFARIKHRDIPKAKLMSWAGCKNAWKVHVQTTRLGKAGMLPLVSSVSPQPASHMQQAVLVKTGPMQGKSKDFIFGLPDEQASSVAVSDEVLRAYREQVTEDQKSLVGGKGLLQDMQPVFYLIENGNLAFFGHTMMFRLPYGHTPFDLVPSTLRSESNIDLAEAVFGYVSEGNRETVQAGRVFFTDAQFESDRDGVWLSEEPIAPAILGSPKPTTFQHYLTQQGPDDKRQLDHYASPPPHTTVIRGHKLYWHRGAVERGDIEEKNSVDWSTDTQHTQIKPVKAGVTFRFTIHFENLSNVELGALLWAMTLPGETDKQYRHKLGMGKPLGMGSVKIMPVLYLSDRQSRYTRLFEGEAWHKADRRENNTQPFLNAFENYVLAGMDQGERGQKKSLKDVERIQMLLKMLEWAGPDRQLTEYMRIEPVNEYKERPVLPDPLNIEQPTSTLPRSSPRPRRGKSRNQKGRQRR